MAWSQLDHTGDAGIEVRASDLEGLFVEALRGFTDCLSEVDRVGRSEHRTVELEAAAPDLLLVDWLQEALFLFDTESLLFSDAEIELDPGRRTTDPARLRARLVGERFDPARHPVKAPIKAVTYHGLDLGCAHGVWWARLVFDL